jgi:hypothetical protein
VLFGTRTKILCRAASSHRALRHFPKLCCFGQISLPLLIKVVLYEIPAKETHMLLLIIILLLVFGGGGGYYGYSRWGTGGGLGIVGTVLLIIVVLYLLGAVRV